jgi:hypothetical protein
MKRKNEEMQGELSNLRQLYDFLRLKPEHEAFEILRQIRETPPDTSVSQRIKQLADSVRQGDIPTPASRQSPCVPSVQSTEPNFTLPPLRMALDSLGQDTPGYSSSPRFPRSILNDEPQDPMSQRRKYTSGADVSTRSVPVFGSAPLIC